MTEEEKKCRYFIAKCANIGALQTCITKQQWACKDRVTSLEQPREILTAAFEDCSKLIIIFSVNNCHGWHGYTEMVTKPCLRSPENKTSDSGDKESDSVKKNAGKRSDSCCEQSHKINYTKEASFDNYLESHDNYCSGSVNYCGAKSGDLLDFVQGSAHNVTLEKEKPGVQILDEYPWYYFDVKWVTEFLTKFGEQCLPSQKTADIHCIDNTPLNKARNWNELDEISGRKVCFLIDEQYKKLECKRHEKIKLQERNLPPPFIKKETIDSVAHFVDNWSLLMKRVQSELGAVILACPFGSQRYNLDTVHSDMDMFVVYQTSTKALLNFDPQPQQTIKSSEREPLDYTIHELHRFGELLLAGDHRCVETLFLHQTSYVASSEAFQQLIENRQYFLNSLCLDKYLRDALGGKGLKLFEKWTKDRQSKEKMTERESKLAYIIIRLLRNAKNVVDGVELQVYRDEESEERKLLISLKTKDSFPTIQFALNEIYRLKTYIEENRGEVPGQSGEVNEFMNNWILNLRKVNLLSQ